MEMEEDTIGKLSCAPKLQLKSGKNENMTKEFKTMMGSPTKTVYMN